MDCLNPITIKLPEKSQCHHDGYTHHTVPCGRCDACLKRKAGHWYTRLKLESRYQDYTCFVTLTYDDRWIPSGHNVSKSDIQLYHKRLRQKLTSAVKLKYYLVSEYGPETLRPHYHCIYFGVPPTEWHKFEESWQLGFVTVDNVTDSRIRYVSGYIIGKSYFPEGREKVFSLMSKGLGNQYISEYKEWHQEAGISERCYVPYMGQKLQMPRYYKERIYNSGQRKLYAKKLSDDAEQRIEQLRKIYGDSICANRLASSADNYIKKVNQNYKKRKN